MKYILILPLLFAFALVWAQTGKGSFIIGGNGHVRYETQSTPAWNIDVNPNIGYFTGKNFALGLGLPVSYYVRKSTSSSGMLGSADGQLVEVSRFSQYSIGIAPFIRGYIGQGRFRPLLQAQAGVSREKYTTVYRDYPRRDYMEYEAFGSGAAGIAYFVSEHVGIEALFNAIYNPDNMRRFPPTSVGLYLGVQFYLPRKSAKP